MKSIIVSGAIHMYNTEYGNGIQILIEMHYPVYSF